MNNTCPHPRVIHTNIGCAICDHNPIETTGLITYKKGITENPIDSKDRIAKLESRIITLITYMESKIEARDWHAVADAAMDIREIEAKKELYIELSNKEVK